MAGMGRERSLGSAHLVQDAEDNCGGLTDKPGPVCAKFLGIGHPDLVNLGTGVRREALKKVGRDLPSADDEGRPLATATPRAWA